MLLVGRAMHTFLAHLSYMSSHLNHLTSSLGGMLHLAVGPNMDPHSGSTGSCLVLARGSQPFTNVCVTVQALNAVLLLRSEVKERMKKTKADKQAQKASQPKGGAKATKVMPKGGPGAKGGKR